MKRGFVKKGDIIDRTGEKFITNEGYEVEIVQYFGVYDCTIRFSDGTIICNMNFGNIKKGTVKNPNHKSVQGIGYFGIGEYKAHAGNSENTTVYNVWRNMIIRCYNSKAQLKQPAYIGCSVHHDWHCFQNYAKWYYENKTEDWYVDKDILFKGNKVYSPETCCFVPNEINVLFTNSRKSRGEFPVGVQKYSRKFKVALSINGKHVYLGLFSTIEEAFQIYKTTKESHIKEVANLWRPRIMPKVYEAMINYEVEITD